MQQETQARDRVCARPARVAIIFAAAWLTAFAALSAEAQQTALVLDPAQTRVEFTLGAMLHTVHGTFKLQSGQIQFDPRTGRASGSVVVDATSGDSENSSRDKKMHQEVLESQQYREVIFTPDHVKGALASQGTSQMEVHGIFQLHGQAHPMTLTFRVAPIAGNQLHATTHFKVPYVKWGLKDPSTFILRVDDTVDVNIQAVARIVSESAQQ